MRLSLILLAALGPVLLAGCKGPCRQLAEQLCECEPNTVEKEDCLQKAQIAERAHEPTAEDDSACLALIEAEPYARAEGEEPRPACDCSELESENTDVRARAKKACGLAR